jgi:hypothetical protein
LALPVGTVCATNAVLKILKLKAVAARKLFYKTEGIDSYPGNCIPSYRLIFFISSGTFINNIDDKILFMRTIVLLLASNIFMTFAWYYHPQQKDGPFGRLSLSWLIAFFEYCLMVPANR